MLVILGVRDKVRDRVREKSNNKCKAKVEELREPTPGTTNKYVSGVTFIYHESLQLLRIATNHL